MERRREKLCRLGRRRRRLRWLLEGRYDSAIRRIAVRLPFRRQVTVVSIKRKQMLGTYTTFRSKRSDHFDQTTFDPTLFLTKEYCVICLCKVCAWGYNLPDEYKKPSAPKRQPTVYSPPSSTPFQITSSDCGSLKFARCEVMHWLLPCLSGLSKRYIDPIGPILGMKAEVDQSGILTQLMSVYKARLETK